MPVDEGELLVRYALHEIAVMRDEDEGAGPAVEQVLYDGEHVGIKVVSGLVEDEHVGFFEEREHEL